MIYKKNTNKLLILAISLIYISSQIYSQPLPSNEEKFPFLITFSQKAEKKWGDDDFVQILFFAIPENHKDPVYIRVFDPEIGGKNDENKNSFNSKTKFSIYGGKGAHSNKDAQNVEPIGNYKSGSLIVSKTFGVNLDLDNQWYTFGPINPTEGEFQPENGGYILKVVIEGLDGDDGNLYQIFLSKSNKTNAAIDGGNSFCYEYTARLPDQTGTTCHVYPFVPKDVVKVKVNIFDYDDEGIIRILSIAKKGDFQTSSTEGTWSLKELKVVKEEINTSLDIQFIKKKLVKNNNISIYITNQYNEAIPFYSVPIGGVPNYKYKIEVTKAK